MLEKVRKVLSFLSAKCKLDGCLQWQSQQQHLEDEVCRLETEVTSLEEVKCNLDNRQVASEQTLQSHNAVIADLRLQLDNIKMEKVGFGMCRWTPEPEHFWHNFILVTMECVAKLEKFVKVGGGC